MAYRYLEHGADVGIISVGATLEEAFHDGVKAMLNVMFDTDSVSEKEAISIHAEAEDIAALFVEVLNEILFKMDTTGIVFSRLQVKEIKKRGNVYYLKGTVCGEPLNLEKHAVKTEVKAATYAGLKFEEKEGSFILQCILDV